MRRVLAMTVGGNPDPVVTSLQSHRPSLALFFVTDEPRGGSRALLERGPDGGPGILAAAGLSAGSYRDVVLDHPDDFASCYRAMREAMRTLQAEFEGAELIADYTGGTKTMTAALAAAAFRLGWRLSLVESPRTDLEHARGAGAPVVQSPAPLVLDELKGRVNILYGRRNYEGAAEVLAETLRDLSLPPEERRALVLVLNLLRGLDHWDRFDYAQAYALLRNCGVACPELLPHLARLAEFAEARTQPPYALVADLWANAEGRASQGRYEDAVLRLYRAVELLAQVRLLLQHGLDTGDLDLARVPPPLRNELASRAGKRATAGLLDGYRILDALGDPLGKLFADGWADRIRELLLLRNKAFMEHGFQPLGKDGWERAREIGMGFLEAGAAAIGLKLAVPRPPTWEAVERLFPS